MAKQIFAIILFVQFTFIGATQVFGQRKSTQNVLSKDIASITGRLIEDYLAEEVDYSRVKEVIASLKSDGSWPHIDYTTVGNHFPAGTHLKNLKLMALAFAKQGTDFYHNEQLKQQILLAYQFYFDKKPTSLNWWYNEIGGPQDYMAGLILIKDRVANEDLMHYASYLKDLTDNPGHQGMNRIWVSAITITKGCLENNELLIKKGFQSVASTLVITNEQNIEGINIDNSFHQHRAQLYSGGYGMGFAESTATLIALSANTSFNEAFSTEKKKLFSDMLLYGHQLFSYRGAVDFGTIGRNISRPNAIAPISLVTLDKMAVIDPQRAPAFRDWKDHLQGASFPKAFIGNKYFWKSDMMVQHGADYYLSAKVISTRTTGTEMLNGENLKGYNLPLGATNIMKTGAEYKNIFPIWDWTRIPGTTAVMNQSATILPWYLFGSNEFAGGVSDGAVGAIAYEHRYNGVQAKKAYFFVDGAMLCLGAGIHAIRTQQVITSVNQCYSKGDIMVGGKHDPDGMKFTDSLRTFKNRELQWFYHDGIGYIFPQGGHITLKNVSQQGSWKSINNSESQDIISQPVFSLWLNHGTAPKEERYCYIVRPESSLTRFLSKISTSSFVVIRNDPNVQAVNYQHTYFIIFYKPGQVTLADGLQIATDAPMVLMAKEQHDGFQISVADPTHQQAAANIFINQGPSNTAVIEKRNATKINFKFPQGDYAGSTISQFYKK